MEFKRHDHFDALADQAEAWNKLVKKSATDVPFLTYEYQRAWWQTRGGGEWPDDSRLILISAMDGDRLVGVAPLFHAENILGDPALMFVGAIEVSDFLDFIVAPEDLTAFTQGLIDFLLNNPALPEWKLLDLYNLLGDSPTLDVLEKEAQSRGWAHKQVRLQPAPYVPLPGDYEAYLAEIDKKQRHEIRRKLRNVEQSLAEGNWYIVTDETTLQSETRAFIDMMAQDPNKKAFLTEAMQEHLHNTAQTAFEHGWLQLSFFTLDGQKAAAYMSFNYDNRLWLYNSGWEWEYRDFSPGWVLLAYLLEWANENGIEAFDFMRGDERYKYKFGGVDRFVHRVTLTP
jgi:CelD/BcsL family acetyltransferase involved in cellulose biosynthesis